MLRVNQLAVEIDVEDSTGTRDQERFDAERVFELCRQTDGFGLVVSLHAVGDRDVHETLLSGTEDASLLQAVQGPELHARITLHEQPSAQRGEMAS